jgi:hypothetical protein
MAQLIRNRGRLRRHRVLGVRPLNGQFRYPFVADSRYRLDCRRDREAALGSMARLQRRVVCSGPLYFSMAHRTLALLSRLATGFALPNGRPRNYQFERAGVRLHMPPAKRTLSRYRLRIRVKDDMAVRVMDHLGPYLREALSARERVEGVLIDVVGTRTVVAGTPSSDSTE